MYAFSRSIAAAAALAFSAAAVIAPAAGSSEQDEPMELLWEDLMPEGEIERLQEMYNAFYSALYVSLADAPDIEEGSPEDYMPQLGTFNTVEELDGQRIRMPGYVVPFDFSSDQEVTEFLLVPYFGACIHTPPPPPNQIVYVTAEPAAEIGDIWAPVWVEGVMTTQRNDNELGNAAYTLALSSIEPYF